MRTFNHRLRKFTPAAHSLPVSLVDYHLLPLLFAGIRFISKARFFLALNSPMTLSLNFFVVVAVVTQLFVWLNGQGSFMLLFLFSPHQAF